MHRSLSCTIGAVILLAAGAAWGDQFGKSDQIGQPSAVISPTLSIKTASYEATMDRSGQIAEVWRIDADRVRHVRLAGRISFRTEIGDRAARCRSSWSA